MYEKPFANNNVHLIKILNLKMEEGTPLAQQLNELILSQNNSCL